MSVVEVADPAERSRICEAVLRDLPDWFGIEEATTAYIRGVADLPTFAIDADGFLTLKVHNPKAAEVYVMGVRRHRHGQGLGTALLRSSEAYLRTQGVEYLQVKTLARRIPTRGTSEPGTSTRHGGSSRSRSCTTSGSRTRVSSS